MTSTTAAAAAATAVGKSSRKSSTSTIINLDDDGFMGCLSSLSLDNGIVILSPTAMMVGRPESEASRVTTPRSAAAAPSLAAAAAALDGSALQPLVATNDGSAEMAASSNMAVGDMTSILHQLLAEDSVYHQHSGM